MNKKYFTSQLSLAALFTAVAVFSAGQVVASEPQKKDPIGISTEPVTPSTKVIPFHAADAFRLLLADYASEIRTLKAKATRTPVENTRLEKLEAQTKNLLVAYDRVIKVAPIVWALSIQFGADFPAPFLAKLPILNKIKLLNGGGQVLGGVTMAMTRSAAGGSVGARNFAFAGSTLAGAMGSVVKQPAVGQVASKINWIAPAVVVTVPMNEDVEPQQIGDLQGFYFGGSVEFSKAPASTGNVQRPMEFGVYAKPNGLAFPKSAMLVFASGVGGVDRPISADALWFSVLYGNDGSRFRSPIPGIGNFSTSPHAPANREATVIETEKEVDAFSAQDLINRVLDIQKLFE